MSNTKIIKRRIKTSKNISQITRAMETVAASKMKRAQDKVCLGQDYAGKLITIIQNIVSRLTAISHPLTQSNPSATQDLLILFTSNKGLYGSLLTNLFRYIVNQDELDISSDLKVVTIGKKARSFIKSTPSELVAEFIEIPDFPKYSDSLPISQLAIDGFIKKNYRHVYLGFPQFISTLTQQPTLVQLLPIKTDFTLIEEEQKELAEYLFEPNLKKLIDHLLPYYVHISTYQALLSSQASEHSARMVAMKNASDNASRIVDELQLIYNRARQSKITAELLDITNAQYV